MTIKLTKGARVINPCTGGTFMHGLIVVLVGTIIASIFMSIPPMLWELIVGVPLLTPCEWWMTIITRRGGQGFYKLGRI